MTVNHLVTGSNPVSGATFLDIPQTPLNTILKQNLAPELTNYDTFTQKCDTTPLRLYKVGKTFYYRRKIKQKLFRISLRTKSIKTALKRRKVLDLIDGDEMFRISVGDLKLMFEYDTEEELRTALEAVKEMQIQAQLQRFREVKEHVESAENNTSDLTFELLRAKYIARKKADGRVSADSIDAYNTTFKMLIEDFKDKLIEEITVEEFEDWKDTLVTRGGRSNRTINKHMNYTKQFLKFAFDRHLISHNNAKPVSELDEIKDKQQRKMDVENYSDEDLENILSYEYKEPIVKKVFLIALYTALRQNEINSLTQDNIIQDEKTGIYYFNIIKSKSVAGIRKVPIHDDILQMVLDTPFPLIPNKSHNAFGKQLRYQLYKVIEQGKGKNFHSFRGTFIKRARQGNKTDKQAIYMIQDIVGHAKGEARLTLDDYGKGFDIDELKEVVDNIKL